MDDQKKGGVPDYGSSSGFSGDVPQSGMVHDEKKHEHKPHRPPSGNGSESGSQSESTDTATTTDNPNANR